MEIYLLYDLGDEWIVIAEFLGHLFLMICEESVSKLLLVHRRTWSYLLSGAPSSESLDG